MVILSCSAFFFASLLGLTLNAIKIAFDAFAKEISVSVIIPISDKIIFGLTSSCFIWDIAPLIASEDPWTSDFIIIFNSSEILEIFKVSKVGKVAGSKVIEGEVLQDSNARVIRDGTIIFNGKIGSIFREKNQAKQVSAGLECGITIKNFNDFQKKDIIEVYNSTVTERTI